MEIDNIFLPTTEQNYKRFFTKHENLDTVFRQLKSWHKYKTKPNKADITILGNKTLLRYFRNFNNTSINENTDILEYETPDLKVTCLPLSMMLSILHILYKMKGH